MFTTLYDRALTGGVFDGLVIRTSFLQRLPLALRWHHLYSPLMPLAVERFNTAAFDTVLSVSASFAKGVITAPDTRHICYCLTPPRFLWDDSQRFVARFGYPLPIGKLAPLALSYLRVWDRQDAERVDDHHPRGLVRFLERFEQRPQRLRVQAPAQLHRRLAADPGLCALQVCSRSCGRSLTRGHGSSSPISITSGSPS